MIEKIFASIVVVVCLALLVRQFIGVRRRFALDAALLRMTSGVRHRWRSWQWRSQARSADRSSRQASKLADDTIRKARETAARKRDVARDGNVYTPKSFGDKRDSKRDTLH